MAIPSWILTKIGEQFPVLTSNQYLFSLSILATFILIAIFLKYTQNTILKLFVGKTKTDLDDKILEATKPSTTKLIILAGIYLATIPLNLHSTIVSVFTKIIVAIAIFITTILVMRVLDVIIDFFGKKWAKRTKSGIDDELIPLFHRISKILIFIFGIIYILNYFGFNITSLLAGIGIAGIAIGFAVKDSLANIFGGISLILDGSIKVGDKIQLASGELGIIEDIGLRSTQIRTFNNEVLIIPNGKLSNEMIQNYVKPSPPARVVVPFSVAYGTKVDKVKKVVETEIRKIKDTLIDKDHPLQITFEEMADFSLNFNAKFWVPDYNNAYSKKIEANEKIYSALNKSKIDIPFPTSTIYLKKGKT